MFAEYHSTITFDLTQSPWPVLPVTNLGVVVAALKWFLEPEEISHCLN